MFSRIITILIIQNLLVLIVLTLQAGTITVDLNGGGDYLTIQEGINASSDGDTVLVASGVYYENIDFLGKGIVVTSIDGPENSIINGQNWMIDAVVCMASTENDSTAISGFSIQSGVYGIYLISVAGAPLITDNIITNNESAITSVNINYSMSPRIVNNKIIGNSGGYTINSYWSNPLISNNLISNNMTPFTIIEFFYMFDEKVSSFRKRGKSRVSKNAYLINNVIIDNEYNDAISVVATGFGRQVYCANNLIIRNGGDGISLNCNGGIFCSNNTIVENGGSGIQYSGSDLFIKNNLVCNNGEYGIYGTDDHDHNNVWNNTLGNYLGGEPGPGDISEDPLFKDPYVDDFHLMSDSPCIDAGTSTVIGFDMDMDHRPSGDGFDIGADEWVLPIGPRYRWFQLD